MWGQLRAFGFGQSFSRLASAVGWLPLDRLAVRLAFAGCSGGHSAIAWAVCAVMRVSVGPKCWAGWLMTVVASGGCAGGSGG